MSLWIILLGGLLPWLLMFGAAVYLIQLWKRPGPDQLDRAELAELREQVSLMRDFLRDAMERIRQLENADDDPALPPPRESPEP